MLYSEQTSKNYYTHLASATTIEPTTHSFLKTKICPYFLKGKCNNGSKCTFAHSNKELRELPNHHKTKLCKAYASENAIK